MPDADYLHVRRAFQLRKTRLCGCAVGCEALHKGVHVPIVLRDAERDDATVIVGDVSDDVRSDAEAHVLSVVESEVGDSVEEGGVVTVLA